MFSNYLKIAWRNVFRNKGFSITNILGLGMGITCTLLILLWVQDELTYDQFQKNYDHIYQVFANRNFNNQIFTDPSMVFPLAGELEKASPQIKNAVVTTYPESHVLAYHDIKLKKTGYTVGGNYFDMFSWKLIKGNTGTFRDPLSVVLTASTAKAFFGNEDPIGKTIRFDKETDLHIKAVVADPPGNSSLKFDFIKPFNYSSPDVQRNMNEWVNSSWQLYVQTRPAAHIEGVDRIINQIKQQHDPNDKKVSTYFSFPMRKWRLYSDFKNGKNTGGMIEYVKLFSLIAVIILLIACVNFMNLSTARSEKRAKEVGIRKTLGSERRQLLLQFYFESMLLAFIAFVFAACAVYALLPAFNHLVDKHLSLELYRPVFWEGAIAIIVFTGAIAGSYPALYLSSFNPVKVLKGNFLPGWKAAIPRRVLVVAQFVISILLISATLIVYQQIQHVKNRDIGYDPNNLITIPASPDVNKNYAAIRQELHQSGLISAVTRTFSPITQIWWKSPAPDWDGKQAGMNIIMTGFSTDIDFIKTIGITMDQGKDFSGTPSDSSSMLLNKAAVQAMGLKNPLGMQMRYGPRTYTVTGITDNLVMESPFKPVEPMMIFYQPNNSNIVDIRLKKSVYPQHAISAIEAIFKKYNPSFPFEYSFVDEEFGKKFLTEELIGKLTNIFAVLAIFICCIGLAGLASYTIEKRIREIGIRKVLGASVQQVLMLIAKEFLKLVAVACLIAIPLTWWLMNKWLQNYEYRIYISIWLFCWVSVAILLLTLLVVSLNTIRAAVRNPVKSLRTE